MPMRDGRGPRGMGPMTGRGMGYCNPRRNYRRSYGRGRAMGPGMRRGYFPREDFFGAEEYDGPVNDKEFLEREKSELESRLNEIKEILGDNEEE